MRTLRKFYRYILLSLLLIIGIPLSIVFLRRTVPTDGISSTVITTWLSLVIRCLGIRLKIYGTALTDSTLFISNHISWLDVIIHGSLVPAHILSKHEVKSMPVLGWLATKGGTLYIKRGNKNAVADANSQITAVLKQQHNSLIFAEGTTSDGTTKRFHSRMMQSAIDAQAMVQPIAIYYPVLNTKTKHIESNPATLFIGDTTFSESADLILGTKSIDVEVHYLEPINSTGKTRDEISQHAYNEVVKAISFIKER